MWNTNLIYKKEKETEKLITENLKGYDPKSAQLIKGKHEILIESYHRLIITVDRSPVIDRLIIFYQSFIFCFFFVKDTLSVNFILSWTTPECSTVSIVKVPVPSKSSGALSSKTLLIIDLTPLFPTLQGIGENKSYMKANVLFQFRRKPLWLRFSRRAGLSRGSTKTLRQFLSSFL